MSEQMCSNCRFWEIDGKDVSAKHEDDHYWTGLCRRYPPILLDENRTRPGGSRFPVTPEGDWCGEWGGRDKKPIDGTPIDYRLGLSARVENCLRTECVTTDEQLLQLGARGLLELRNFGEKCLEEVELYLRRRGHELS